MASPRRLVMEIDVGTAAAPLALKSTCFVLQFRLERPAHQMRRTTTARARNFGDVTLSNVGFRGVLMKHMGIFSCHRREERPSSDLSTFARLRVG